MSRNQVIQEKKRSIAEKAKTAVLKQDELEEAGREADEEKNTEKSDSSAEKTENAPADDFEENGGETESGKKNKPAENESEKPENDEAAAGSGQTGEKEESPLEQFDTANGITLDLQADRWDIYTFMMYHTYCSVTGVIGVLLSLFCLGEGIMELSSGQANTMTAVLLIVGLWFTVISPLMMIRKSASQIKRTPSLQKPITYTFTKVGMIQEQGEIKTGCFWKQITKVVFMKRIWIMYAGKVRGNVIPVRQLQGREEELKQLIKAHTGKKSSEY